MGATEEQMHLVAASGLDHVAYILILYSLAFLVFLFTNMLIYLYDRTSNPLSNSKPVANGRIRENGHAVEQRRAHDAEEFELEGLMSDDEDDEGRRLRRDIDDEHGLMSPSSSVGKNSEGVAR